MPQPLNNTTRGSAGSNLPQRLLRPSQIAYRSLIMLQIGACPSEASAHLHIAHLNFGYMGLVTTLNWMSEYLAHTDEE